MILLILSVSFSCKLREKLVYFNQSSEKDSIQSTYHFKFKPGDIVNIKVSSLDMDAVKPFNVDYGIRASPDGYTTGSSAREGFLIDESGTINFPVLGKVKIGGLNRDEAEEILTTRLKEFIDQPILNIHVMNFKISVLGSVGQPGTFTVPNERITVFEALGLAGDLKITGNRKNVVVIREKEGKKTQINLDLTSTAIFNSEAYYLEQNDIVYAEPNKAERYTSTLFKSTGGLLFSILSVILTTYLLIIAK